MSEYINPFDFKKIFIEYFLGTEELFMFAFLIIFSFACAKYGMSNRVFLLLLLVSSIIFSFILGQVMYILIVLIAGIVIFKSISRLIT